MDHYATLGVNKTASEADIKKAYRKLASQHHPDKGGDSQTFQKIQAAYEVIGDANKRAQYDAGVTGGWQRHRPQNFSDSVFEDIFNNFAHDSPFAESVRRSQRRPVRNPDATSTVTITLEQSITGTDMVLDLGHATEVIQIQPGVHNNTKLRVPGKGPHRFREAPPGDLIVTVKVQMPDRTMVNGIDIYQEVKVDALTAMVGGDTLITLPDRKQVKLKIPAGTNSDAKFKIPRRGKPMYKNPSQRGDYYAVIRIVTPQITNPEHLELLNTIKQEVDNEQ
jgi:curved DNA-binding protein